MFSVVIPLYNKEDSIERAINSVLSQSFSDFEVIVVDDGSTDRSFAIVSNIEDHRVRIIKQSNSGVSVARNVGIKAAKFPYIALLDADDRWLPGYLEEQASLIRQFPECDMFATDYLFEDRQGKLTNTIIRGLKMPYDQGVFDNYFKVASNSHPPISSISVVISRRALDHINGFPIGIKSGEDLVTWAKLACVFKTAYSKKRLAVVSLDGYAFSDKPRRVPQTPDIVGEQLELLLKQYSVRGLRAYVALWHKMRSSIYLRLGMKRESILESIKGLRFNPLNYKLYAYLLLALFSKSSKSSKL